MLDTTIESFIFFLEVQLNSSTSLTPTMMTKVSMHRFDNNAQADNNNNVIM
jgi:hypothetical protein